MSRLILMTKTNSPKQVELTAARTVIGRDVSSDLQIDRPRISRRHAELSSTEEGTWIEDLGSSNGTFVNGRQIQRQELHHGDVVRLGDCDIRYLTRETNFALAEELSLADHDDSPSTYERTAIFVPSLSPAAPARTRVR
ncbi:MAG: FHA domain-containing protein [Variovorax sp.]